MQPLKGEIFIIPNTISIYGPKTLFEGIGYQCIDIINNPHIYQVCLHVWIYSKECDNWSCDKHPKLKDKISDFIPAEIFMGKKEGDVIELNLFKENRKFILTCKQLGKRYNDHGRFEKVVEECLGKYYPTSYLQISEELQNSLFKKTQEKYKKSITNWTKKNHKESLDSTKQIIKTVLMLNLKTKSPLPIETTSESKKRKLDHDWFIINNDDNTVEIVRFDETFFYTLPKDILFLIFEFLHLYEPLHQ